MSLDEHVVFFPKDNIEVSTYTLNSDELEPMFAILKRAHDPLTLITIERNYTLKNDIDSCNDTNTNTQKGKNNKRPTTRIAAVLNRLDACATRIALELPFIKENETNSKHNPPIQKQLVVTVERHAYRDLRWWTHIVNWNMVVEYLQDRPATNRPSAMDETAIIRAGDVIERVIQRTDRQYGQNRRTNEDPLPRDTTKINNTHKTITQVMFSKPILLQWMVDVLYNARSFIHRVARWAPDSPIYFVTSNAGNVFEVTPYGIGDATLFHFNLNNGFSLRNINNNNNIQAPRPLNSSFQLFYGDPLHSFVLPDIFGQIK